MKTGSQFENRGDAALSLQGPCGWLRDSAEKLEQRALTRSILTDHAYGFARLDLEGHVLQRRERRVTRAAAENLHETIRRTPVNGVMFGEARSADSGLHSVSSLSGNLSSRA